MLYENAAEFTLASYEFENFYQPKMLNKMDK